MELTDELIRLQQASDEAREAVFTGGDPEAWAVWRERAAEVQNAVTAYAKEIGEPRNAVEAALKKAARHPDPQ
ncbi:hypothetical protein EF918_20375 [Streptomyces sp. WAC06614]|nr:hypothetical protein EF918_20375 [Streptomyces sp. WAC06614]